LIINEAKGNGWATDNRIQDCPSACPLSIRCRLFKQTAAFANNHWQGQAVDTARQLKLLLCGWDTCL